MSEIKTVFKTTGCCGPCSASEPAEFDVRDGRILRIRPFSYVKNQSKDGLNAWTMHAKGKEFHAADRAGLSPYALLTKNRVYSPNRILYPMIREDWDPEGERNTQNRGVSGYKRISWDEATDIIAKEVLRVKDQYGMNSIFIQSDGHHQVKTIQGPRGCQGMLCDILGGYTMQARNPDSWEGWYWGAKHVWGQDPVGQSDQTNNFADVAHNSDALLHWGCDVCTAPFGWGGQFPSRYCFFLRDIGVLQIAIAPDFNYGAAAHADKWIPVYPNTDSAMQLAIIYTWLEEGTFDQEYIDTHSIGFDWIKYHVYGGDDGIEKTPKWAEGVCGVPARTIKALARYWAKHNVSISHGNGGSFIRSTYSHEPARLEVVLLAMQALGHPGRNQVKMMEYQLYCLGTQMPAPRAEMIPDLGALMIPYAADNRESLVPETLVPEALAGDYDLEHPLKWFGTTVAGIPTPDQFIEYKYPARNFERIHMLWIDSPKWTSSWNCGNMFIDAVRSPIIETVVCQHIWMEDDTLLSDIILPVNTKWEEEDIVNDVMSGNYNAMFIEDKVIEPLGESLSDYEAVMEVAKKVEKMTGENVVEEYTGGMTVLDKMKKGYNTCGIKDRISWEEFYEKKQYVVPAATDWEDDPAGMYAFYSDPVKHPLGTPSGKLEFYSPRLAQCFPEDKERMPYPRWIEKGETHPDERLTTPRAQKYPFLLVSNHPHFRMHSQFDDAAWMREIGMCKVVGPDGYAYEPLWMNPKDAEKLGIQHHDIVKIFNERGWTMGGVIVTERIAEHTVLQDHGARIDPIEPGVSDRGGTNNLIAPKAIVSKNCAGEVTSGFLVGVEKVDVFELAKQYPEAFGRPYDPETGPLHIQRLIEE